MTLGGREFTWSSGGRDCRDRRGGGARGHEMPLRVDMRRACAACDDPVIWLVSPIGERASPVQDGSSIGPGIPHHPSARPVAGMYRRGDAFGATPNLDIVIRVGNKTNKTRATKRTASQVFDPLTADVVRGFTEALLAMGAIPPGKNQADALRAAMEFRRRHPNMELALVVDHKPTVLWWARHFREGQRLQYSALFYALWFEHWLNGLLRHLSRDYALSERHFADMLRGTNFEGKTTWLITLLRGQPIYSKHLKVIRRVLDVRNAFVHYKWKVVDDDGRDQTDVLLDDAEKTVKYLRSYERKYVLQGRKLPRRARKH